MTTETKSPGDQARGILTSAGRELIKAAETVAPIFLERRESLNDLSPAFWVAIGTIQGAAMSSDTATIASAVKQFRRTLGAPGDFGYGTACGDAIRILYDATRVFLNYSDASQGI